MKRTSFSGHRPPPSPARRLAVLAFALGLAVASLPVRAEAPAPEEAKRFIADLASRTSETLSRKDQSLEVREASMRDLLRESFDLVFISRIALGKHWRQLTPSERSTYTDLFGDFVLHTYAPRLGGFENQKFKVDDAIPRGKQDIVVLTRILSEDGPEVKAGWRVRSVDGKFRIIDVIVEGVSMTLNQRHEFTAVVSRDGMQGLLEMLRDRVQRSPIEPPA